MVTHETDVAVVGAGPYGLSIAAHLAGRGIEHRIFGPPMKFWRDMPAGINLKSFAFATSVYVPVKGHTFPEWCRSQGLEDFEPCTMASFAAYGMSMQSRFVPNVETVDVKSVSLASGGKFDLVLANEEPVRARRVVFATGLSHLKYSPPAVEGLSPEHGTHTADLSDYSVFRGKEVVVLGAGSSAIEAGALVNEAGGRAQILVREDQALFNVRMNAQRSLYERLRKPNSVVGPGLKNRFLQEVPLAFFLLPERRRLRFVKGYLGPTAPWWIKDRVDGIVPIHTRSTVVAAEPVGRRVRLRVQVEGQGDRSLEVDHVISGTGYVPNLESARVPRRRPSPPHAPGGARSIPLDELRVVGARRLLRRSRHRVLLRTAPPLRLWSGARCPRGGTTPRGARAARAKRAAPAGHRRGVDASDDVEPLKGGAVSPTSASGCSR